MTTPIILSAAAQAAQMAAQEAQMAATEAEMAKQMALEKAQALAAQIQADTKMKNQIVKDAN